MLLYECVRMGVYVFSHSMCQAESFNFVMNNSKTERKKRNFMQTQSETVSEKSDINPHNTQPDTETPWKVKFIQKKFLLYTMLNLLNQVRFFFFFSYLISPLEKRSSGLKFTCPGSCDLMPVCESLCVLCKNAESALFEGHWLKITWIISPVITIFSFHFYSCLQRHVFIW